MRITNGMIAASTLRNLSAAQNREAAAYEASSSNEKIQLASDDPAVAARAVTYRNYVAQVKQYQDNADAADAWQTATDDALSDIYSQLSTLKTYANEASTSTSDQDAIKEEVTALLSDIIDYMNTDYSGSYIFGGYSTDEEPYEQVSTTIGDTVTFKGQTLSLGGVISSDISDNDITSFLEPYYTTGSDVYDSLGNAAKTADAAGKTTIAATLKIAAAVFGSATNIVDADAAATSDAETLTALSTTYSGTLTAAAATAKEQSDALASAVTAYGESATLSNAVVLAYSDYTTAKAAADADTSSTSLAAAASAAEEKYNALTAVEAKISDADTATLSDVAADALTNYQALATAVSTYTGTTTLSDAAATALSNYNTALAAAGNDTTASTVIAAQDALDAVNSAVSTYGGTATLYSASVSALSDYNSALTAAGGDTTNSAVVAAKAVSDALAGAVADSVGSVTVADAATKMQSMADTLTATIKSSDQSINYNIGFSSEVTVNIEGQDVVGEGTNNIFNTIQKMLLALDGDTSYKSASYDSATGAVTVTTNELSMTDLIDEIGDQISALTTTQAALGSRMKSVSNAQTRLDTAYEQYKSLMTDNENVDTAEALTEVSSAEYTYEATMAVASKVVSKSLIDYIS